MRTEIGVRCTWNKCCESTLFHYICLKILFRRDNPRPDRLINTLPNTIKAKQARLNTGLAFAASDAKACLMAVDSGLIPRVYAFAPRPSLFATTTTRHPMHRPMHGPAFPSGNTPIWPHLTKRQRDYTILLLYIVTIALNILPQSKSTFVFVSSCDLFLSG